MRCHALDMESGPHASWETWRRKVWVEIRKPTATELAAHFKIDEEG